MSAIIIIIIILPMHQFLCSFIQETNISELLVCTGHFAQVMNKADTIFVSALTISSRVDTE